jgi:hypothetical protein
MILGSVAIRFLCTAGNTASGGASAEEQTVDKRRKTIAGALLSAGVALAGVGLGVGTAQALPGAPAPPPILTPPLPPGWCWSLFIPTTSCPNG